MRQQRTIRGCNQVRQVPPRQMKMLAIVFLVVAAAAGAAEGGHVPRCVCSPAECEQLEESDCPAGAGLVWDPCGCCKLCARLEFEACGGPDGFHGSCSHGLECVVTSANMEGTCMRPMNSEDVLARCGEENSRPVSGCNIVDSRCRCRETRTCSGDVAPFVFRDHEECEINLSSMLAQQQIEEMGVAASLVDLQSSGGCEIESAGVIVAHGATWWSDDRCTQCECHGGNLECTSSQCSTCVNPHYLPGTCCPRCDQADVHMPHCPWRDQCTIKCRHGLRKDKDGCFICECLQLEGEGCPLQCPGDRYAKNSNGEDLCECPNQRNKTTPRHVPCIDPDGTLHEDGAEWSDGCRQCACSGGVALCSLLACPRCSGTTVHVPGECCPRCNGSGSETPGAGEGACQSTDGSVRPLGSRWRLEAACAWCECRRGGQVVCGAEPCPPAACDQPVLATSSSLPSSTEECSCPRCVTTPLRPPVDAIRSCPKGRDEGETWREGACSSCACLKNKAVCFEETCPPPPCPFPVAVRGRCCPVCLKTIDNRIDELFLPELDEGCVDVNVTRDEGETWWRSACVQCECHERGRISCSIHCSDQETPRACAADSEVPWLSSYHTPALILSVLLTGVLFSTAWLLCRRRLNNSAIATSTTRTQQSNGTGENEEEPSGLLLRPSWCCGDGRDRVKDPTRGAYTPVKLYVDPEKPSRV